MKLTLTIFISLVLVSTSFCQTATLNGKIISVITNQAPSEPVIIMDYRNKKFAETDSLGNYSFDSLKVGETYNFTFLAFGYNELEMSFTVTKPAENLDFILTADCSFDSAKAQIDIEKGTPKLLLIGSIAPTANSKQDQSFEEIYKVEYFDFGCSPPAIDCILEYNKQIFIYFDKTFESDWRRLVRTDVVGLKQ
jgi:hypothetical protein